MNTAEQMFWWPSTFSADDMQLLFFLIIYRTGRFSFWICKWEHVKQMDYLGVKSRLGLKPVDLTEIPEWDGLHLQEPKQWKWQKQTKVWKRLVNDPGQIVLTNVWLLARRKMDWSPYSFLINASINWGISPALDLYPRFIFLYSFPSAVDLPSLL